MRYIVFFLCMLMSCGGAAQRNLLKVKPVFYSANQVGLLEGDAGSAFMVQTVNGVAYKSWAAGVGIGLDKYRDRSIPLFLQVKKSVFEKKLPLFLYADIGINMLWRTKDERGWQSWQNRNDNVGLYFDGGAQYQWAITQRQAILFSVGYSEKQYSSETYVPAPCINGPCPEQHNTWHFTYRRIAIKAGWKFR